MTRHFLPLCLLICGWLSAAPVLADKADAPDAKAPDGAKEMIPAAFAGPPDGFSKDARTGRIDKVRLAGTKNKNAWFHLAVPKQYDPKQAWPLMIVLHGGPGGRGPDDIVSFFRGGLQAQGVISVYPKSLVKQLLDWNYPHTGAYLLAIIRQVARTYRIDPRRIYLVGVSMGGGGAWAYGAIFRDVWAGIGPISGWYRPNPFPSAKRLKSLPIYCLHGQKDRAVPAQRSRMAVSELKKLGHEVLQLEKLEDLAKVGSETMVYREVPGARHNVFVPWKSQGRAELGKLVGWLLAQKRKEPADLDAAAKALAEWGKPFGWSPGGTFGQYSK
jgi:predicted peptidase